MLLYFGYHGETVTCRLLYFDPESLRIHIQYIYICIVLYIYTLQIVFFQPKNIHKIVKIKRFGHVSPSVCKHNNP